MRQVKETTTLGIGVVSPVGMAVIGEIMKKTALLIFLVAVSNFESFSQAQISDSVTGQQNGFKDVEQAYDHYNRKEWEKASRMFENLQKQNPYYHDFAVRLAFSYFNLAKYDESIIAFQKALETGLAETLILPL